VEAAGIKITQKDFIQKTINVPANLARNSICPTIVLTSKTGVQAWITIVDKLRLDVKQYAIYCLAFGTKALAIKHGLRIEGDASDATSLADVILKNRNIDHVSFICGNRRRDELPETLKFYGVDVQEICAYSTDFTPATINEQYNGILFFSPSAVDSFLQLNKSTPCTAFCIGNTTAIYARKVGFSDIQVAGISTPEFLVEKVIHFYKNQEIHA
jgi:uroporphyrinogen-III synthase